MAYMLNTYCHAVLQNNMIADVFLNECILILLYKGWIDDVDNGILISPDNSTKFVYKDDYHKCELLQYKRGMKKQYLALVKQFLESGYFIEVFE